MAQFVSEAPEFGFRVYVTAAGMRFLCASHLLNPKSAVTQCIFKALAADVKFAAMCCSQGLFAARLRPKLARCHQPAQRYATAQFLWMVGNRVIHPDAESVIQLHDAETEAHSEKPLA